MRSARHEMRECVFEARGARGRADVSRSVEGAQAALVEDSDARGQFLDFAERVRGKEKSRAEATDDFLAEEFAKIGSGEMVEAARGFVEEKNARAMKKCAGEAEAMDHPGGVCADLAVKKFAESKQSHDFRDATRGIKSRKIVHGGEEAQILSPGQAAVEALIAARVVAEARTGAGGIADNIGAADFGTAARGQDQRCQDAQERGFTRAIRANECDRFGWFNDERNSRESAKRGASKRLREGAPSGTRGREVFFEIFDENGVRSHDAWL